MNLYVHFPFCRSRCSYCSLYSRAGSAPAARAEYVESLRVELDALVHDFTRTHTDPAPTLSTLYFGGGSPALCDLSPLRVPLKQWKTGQTCFPLFEFTVELHPLDVTPAKLDELKSIGVNRISMGVQSLNDATLRAMGRGYTLILGYPGDPTTKNPDALLAPLANWGLRHCSVYSLQNDRGLKNVPDDETVLDGIKSAARFLKSIGLERYEISNYAAPGFECRHNLAVWRGEDYVGLGEGACGRVGLSRTRNWWGQTPQNPNKHCGSTTSIETVSEKEDLKERTLFRLRTCDGIDSSRFPEWRPTLDRFVAEGLLTKIGESVYRLTERGTEVCDSILEELV